MVPNKDARNASGKVCKMKGIPFMVCVISAALLIGCGGLAGPVLKNRGSLSAKVEVNRTAPALDDEATAHNRGNYWDIHLVDVSEAIVGKWTSIALDSGDLPHISYHDESLTLLKYAHYDGNEWNTVTVDGTAESDHLGKGTSIALDSFDHPHISYFDGPTRDLKYAHFDGGQWNKVTVDSQGEVGKYTSIAINSSDMPCIAYTDVGDFKLKYAYFDGVLWHNETLPITEEVDRECSLVLDSSDRPRISYYDLTNQDLGYAWFDGGQWHIETVDSQGKLGRWSSLRLDSNERPHISYNEQTNEGSESVKYTYFDGVNWNTEYVDSAGDVGRFTSLALDSTDAPHISYLDLYNEDLKYSYWSGSDWETEIVDPDGDRYCSMAMGANDTPHISYYDFFNSDLRYAVMERDNDHTPPALDVDNSPASGSTGGAFLFNISASDNWYVDTVYVTWSHGNLSGNITLADPGGDGTWIASITLDENTSGLIYTVHIKDTSGNYYVSTARNVPVYDVEPPVFLGDDTTDAPRTGESMDLYVRVTDNIGVGSVALFYSFHAGTYVNASLTSVSGNTWGRTILVPVDAVDLYYYFVVSDLSGNEVNTRDTVGEVHLFVLDMIDPTAFAGPDRVIDQHGNATLDASASMDNIAITNYTWTFTYDGTERVLAGSVVTFKFSIVGTYNVTLNVSDVAGNWATDTLQVTDKDVISPIARAGEDVTMEASSLVELNGSGSTDNVGVVEYVWTYIYIGKDFTLYGSIKEIYFHEVGDYNITLTIRDEAGNNGTDTVMVRVIPLDEDKDDDGMPDVWENRWGFDKDDPTDAELDPDEDGYTNLQEYENDTCPFIWDPPRTENGDKNTDKDEMDWSWVIVVIGIVIVGMMILLFSRKRNGKVGKDQEPYGRIKPVPEKEKENKKKT